MCTFPHPHSHKLADEFWSRRILRCPYDNAALLSFFHGYAQGYLLVLACPKCGRKTQITRYSDPQRVCFRAWTPAEECCLAEQYAQRQPSSCPVCLTHVACRELFDGTLRLECPRCGNLRCAPPQHADPARRQG